MNRKVSFLIILTLITTFAVFGNAAHAQAFSLKQFISKNIAGQMHSQLALLRGVANVIILGSFK